LDRLNVCYFCRQRILPTEEKQIRLLSGWLAHEKCFLSNNYKQYKELLGLEAKYLEVEKPTYSAVKDLRETIRSQKVFVNEPFLSEWQVAFEKILDLEWILFQVNLYYAKASTWRRFLAAISGKLWYMPKDKYIKLWNEKHLELFSAHCDLAILYTPFALAKPLSREVKWPDLQSRASDMLETANDLLVLTGKILSKSRKKLRKFSADIRRDYEEWLETNRLSLSRYDLI